ncbi:family 1 glycosyltransferase [Stachybotrys elegans]|uniref:Family 1 glycosyltransferase n=1 Tax=Stachybotrys elegans TaxID=80388 RepID=A0A8K0SE86_9HYPO|nr:family 1 glycosyltransferase [Stachybotrys elegans]
MLGRLPLLVTVVFAIVAVLLSRRSPSEPPTVTAGRKNTVLFLTAEASGLSNAHVAVSAALLEHYPAIEVHYASFSKLEAKIARISSLTRAKYPTSGANPIYWHGLPGPGILDVFARHWGDTDGMIHDLGAKDYDRRIEDIAFTLSPWEVEEHWTIYEAITDLVDEIDPAIIILDNMLVPAKDFASNNNRRVVSVCPNGLTELIAVDQPWAAMLWKYPTPSTGIPFPVRWKDIPTNIYLHLKLVWRLLTSPMLSSKRQYLINKGIANPFPLSFVVKDAPLLISTIPEADLPMDIMPPHVKVCGPLAIDITPAEDLEQIAVWLKQAPTVLINLGSMFKYNEQRAAAMAGAVAQLLNEQDVQVLWKFEKLGNYNDSVFASVRNYIDSDRLRVESWLDADPMALLRTGHIVLSVHHGGANCYQEAVLAGVPQLILPLWFDLFNFAKAAEYRGIGIWPGKDIAPRWTVDSLSDGFRAALTGPKSASLRQNAQKLATVASSYGGPKAAAEVIAAMASDIILPEA